MIIAETFWELLREPGHWQFEIFTTIIQDVVILGLGWPLVKRLVARHDEKKHGHEHCDEVHPKTVTLPVTSLNGVEYVRVSDLQLGNNSFDKDFS